MNHSHQKLQSLWWHWRPRMWRWTPLRNVDFRLKMTIWSDFFGPINSLTAMAPYTAPSIGTKKIFATHDWKVVLVPNVQHSRSIYGSKAEKKSYPSVSSGPKIGEWRWQRQPSKSGVLFWGRVEFTFFIAWKHQRYLIYVKWSVSGEFLNRTIPTWISWFYDSRCARFGPFGKGD